MAVPGHGRSRTGADAGAHTWKACWGQPLGSSNLASSATLACGNAIIQRSETVSTSRLVSVCLISWLNSELQSGGLPGFAVTVVRGHRSFERSTRTHGGPPF